MGQIVWTDFSWEAFATILTGVLAVGAAYAVGRRQVSILEWQTRLQDLELRSDLFDRRYLVYEKVRLFLLYVVRHGQYPSDEIEQDFLLAMGEAKFLFGERVQVGIEEIWEKAGNYRILKIEMAQTFRAEGHYGDGNPQRERDAFVWISSRFRDLSDLFDELKLGGQLLSQSG